MKHDKSHYQAIKHNGFRWYCFREGIHYLSKKLDDGTYATICCEEEQLESGDFQVMVDDGLTLSKERITRVKKRWRKLSMRK